MKIVVLIFLGGGLGSVLRYLVGQAFQKTNGTFPLGTFLINIIGSLLIGILLGYFYKNSSDSQHLRALLVLGFCGGFTTFSAFSNEALTLIQQHQYLNALFYITGSVLLGITSTFIGYLIVK